MVLKVLFVFGYLLKKFKVGTRLWVIRSEWDMDNPVFPMGEKGIEFNK